MDNIIEREIEAALSKLEYEKVAGLTTLPAAITPFRNLCNATDEALARARKPNPIERYKTYPAETSEVF